MKTEDFENGLKSGVFLKKHRFESAPFLVRIGENRAGV